MTNLPAPLRQQLKDNYTLRSSRVEAWSEDADGTRKALIHLSDGLQVESVILTDGNARSTACLSTQVGCAMGCSFCMTATMGLHRNATTAEIVDQFLHLRDAEPSISHIVFMGMGEPFMNAKNVMEAVAVFHEPRGQNISHRRMTISTCGVADEIVRLGHTGPPVGLAVSLVSADEEKRRNIMPITRRYPLPRLREAILDYIESSGRRVTLEYVLLKGINDTSSDVAALKRFTSGMNAIVNCIPLNPGSAVPYQSPSENDVGTFMKACTEANINITRRYRRGRGINGACGQLAV